MSRMLTDCERQNVIACYASGISGTECARRFGVDKSVIYDWCRKFGVAVRPLSQARRIYAYNDAAFATSSPEASYWLGFLLADGCISAKGHDGLNLSVALQQRDRAHLEKLRLFLGSTRPLRTETATKSVRLDVPSRQICCDLIKRGCHPRKSLVLEFPAAGLFYRRHFVRGYFDGDGSISIQEKRYGQTTVAFIGTEAFLLGLQDILCLDAALPRNALYSHRTASARYLSWTGRNNAKKIYAYLYAESGPYLERKKRTFETSLAYNTVSTVGGAPLDVIKQYIENQKRV